MWYMGGKFRQGKIIAEFVEILIDPDMSYIEPFCGGMGSAVHVLKRISPVKVILSDVNEAVINFWLAIIDGKIPPHKVTDADHDKYKAVQDPKDWLTAWYGIATCFGGAWFASLARHTRGRQPWYDFTPQVNSTLRKRDILVKNKVIITCCDYKKYINIKGAFFYLDPPYHGRRKCHIETVNENEFWQFARDLSINNKVIITCFDKPDDFIELYNWGDTVVRHYSGKNYGNASEKLVCYNKGMVADIVTEV